jgi:predicted nucleic acid-binding protein
MRGYLIDTNVISEYIREQMPHADVVKWLNATPEASRYVTF